MSKPTLGGAIAPTTAAKSTKVQRVDDKAYVVDLAPAFNIGTVPNGGYVAGHFLAVALTHVAKYGHRNVISAHWDFLNRSQAGRATMLVDEVKIARNMSVLHIALYQDGQLTEAPWVSPDARRVVTASVTCRDMATETGQSLDGEWRDAYPPAPADLQRLPLGQDPGWELYTNANFRPNRHWNTYQQRTHATPVGIRDLWMEHKSGEPIENLDLAYLADITPAIGLFSLQHAPAAQTPPGVVFWYPTLNIHMDFKKSLPAEGARWLRLRTSIRSAKNGRYGCDVDIFDADGDVVAQARHVAMIVDMSRNTASRSTSKSIKL
ncbi:hypothetical protein CCM_05264 [Cordyceps militaris CM01]|uniref:Thioesterase family protein n=1 Tax=Cordyceps militaris (strain CM01) TaxID=983644 RepID=G3JIQ8_CORMM|nr:uncharacterized protein CCM_05264 [Cordyceps militaris CM01]EGX91107.1 hypothetical protein CCM_05264 [Cordyceps militaris CM01]